MQDFRETASRSSSQPKYKKMQSKCENKKEINIKQKKNSYTLFGVSIRVTLLLRTKFSSLSVETILGGTAGVVMGKK
jgi:hypothetical protein